MVRIIRQGSNPEDRKYVVTCNHCRTTAEFEHKEGRQSSDQRDGNSMVFKCPTCNKEVWHLEGCTQQWDR